ncbi:MAG: hypothetical protein CFE29_26550 [Bradyrhizobiaceae bacterium PARB1]|nr:MAG: hypothetical protein CFE29_26550 [Bradyrhizobiaceae bacterium PARB1]
MPEIVRLPGQMRLPKSIRMVTGHDQSAVAMARIQASTQLWPKMRSVIVEQRDVNELVRFVMEDPRNLGRVNRPIVMPA